MDINFQQLMAEAGEGFQPIPAGPYSVECEKAEATRSKSAQAPQVRVTLRILGGAHNGRKLFDQFTIMAGNPVVLGFFFDNMAAFGLDRSFFAQLTMADPMPYVAQMLLGRQANVTVVVEPYQGVDRNKVKTYRPIQGGQPAMQGTMPGMPAMIPQPGQFTGAMPVAPQPQFTPQGPPPGFPPQPPYVPQQPQPPMAPQPPQMPQGVPTPPAPQVPLVQEQAPWQQQPAAQYAPPPEQQYQQPQPQPQYAPQPIPIAPGEQQAQPQQAPVWQPQPEQQGAPTWQPSGPPPGYVDPNQPQQAPPQPQPQPQYQQPPQAPPPGVPPMPGRSI